MYKGFRVVLTVPRALAAALTDATLSPALRGAQLADLLITGTRWAVGDVPRRGWVPVAVVTRTPACAVADLLASNTPQRRRAILQALARHDGWLFVACHLAPTGAPALEVCGVPLVDVWRAEAALDELESAWSPDTRIYAADETPVSRAAL